MMNKLKKSGSYTLTKALHKKVTDVFWGGYCDDYFTKERIWKTYTENGYTLDTHTAVAVDVYEQYLRETGDTTKTVIASTASPYKFGNQVLSALGTDVSNETDDFEIIAMLNEKCGMDVPKSLAELKDKKIVFKGTAEKDKLESVIADFLKLDSKNEIKKDVTKKCCVKAKKCIKK